MFSGSFCLFKKNLYTLKDCRYVETGPMIPFYGVWRRLYILRTSLVVELFYRLGLVGQFAIRGNGWNTYGLSAGGTLAYFVKEVSTC